MSGRHFARVRFRSTVHKDPWATRVQLSDLHVARLPLSVFEAGVIHLDNLCLGIDLVLGIRAFEGYRLQFNFREGRLYLFSE